MQVADLHTHSTFSDGTFTPTELVKAAAAAGLGAIALTDHNTSSGLAEFMEAGRTLGMRTIAGTELSTDYDRHEVHIVGLFIPEEHYGDITEYTKALWVAKNKSNAALSAALAREGYPVDYEAMLRASPSGQINRSRFGDEIERLGYMTKKEAFASILRPVSRGGVYMPPKRPDAIETVAFLHSVGAVPVVAHPFLNFRSVPELEVFLKEAIEHGLAGMEVYYSTFSEKEQTEAARTAEKFGLVKSGGSDFHGAAKPNISLGTGKGNLEVPIEAADDLAKIAASFEEHRH